MTYENAIELIENYNRYVGKTLKHIYGWEYKIEELKILQIPGGGNIKEFKPICVVTYSRYIQFTINLTDLHRELTSGRLFEI